MKATLPESSAKPSHEDVPATYLETDTGTTPLESVFLGKGTVHSYNADAETAVEIHVSAGAAWVTMEGDPDDHIIEAGNARVFQGPGLLVAEGLLATNALKLRLTHG